MTTEKTVPDDEPFDFELEEPGIGPSTTDGIVKEILEAPRGARFVRADLHIHTYPSSVNDVTDEKMVPIRIVAQALGEDLQVIAVMDHDRVGPLAETVIAGANVDILVLPGVEVTTSGGHVLGLFAPDQVGQVAKLLAQLKVGDGEGGGTAESASRALECIHGLGGIGILAHIDRAGAFEESHSAAAKRMLMLSPVPFGVELALPTSIGWYGPTDNDPVRSKIIADRATGKNTRMRPGIARVRSSDAHYLDAIGKDPKGAARVTRIKLETPTFEAVRMAFCDPAARMRVESELAPNYLRVIGLAVDGGFLKGGRFGFSDNLTCLVGGRGTGKSTVLETLRWVFGRESEKFESQDGRAPESAIVVVKDGHGNQWQIERNRFSPPTASGHPSAHIPEVEAYSQGEIKKLSDTPPEKAGDILAFVDRFIEGADAAVDEVAALNGKLDHSDGYLVQAETATQNYASVKTELARIDLQLANGKAELEKVVALRKTLADAKLRRDSLRAGLAGEANTLAKTARDLALAAPAGDLPPNVKTALERFNAAVTSSVATASGALKAAAALLSKDLETWGSDDAVVEEQVKTMTAALEKQGLRADLKDLNNLMTRRATLSAQKDKMDVQRAELDTHRKDRQLLLDELDAARVRLSIVREQSAARITHAIKQVLDGGRVQFGFRRDQLPRPYLDLLVRVARGSGRHETTLRRLAQNVAPGLLHGLVLKGDAVAVGKLVIGTGTVLTEEVARDLLDGFKGDARAVHQLQHVGRDDLPMLVFITTDNTTKQFAHLSQGQKHTILLSIAFSGTKLCPLFIDQPEDELDNLFVFEHVVERLRDVKERRQVIVVSHNANVVVLGDAELIHVLARGEHDHFEIRKSGSIDNPDVKREVLSVLEGGPVAFQRRGEMYGL